MLVSCLLLLSAAIMLGECIVPPEVRYGAVEILAVDLTGLAIPVTEVEYFPTGARVADAATKSPKSRLKYGEYRLRVYAPGFRSAWSDVVVDQTETTVRVQLEVSSLGCPHHPTSIGGTVQQDRSEGELWVKVIPVRGTGGGESRVSKSGYFLVSGLQHGAYVVMVMRGERILQSEVVRTYSVGADTSKLKFDVREKR